MIRTIDRYLLRELMMSLFGSMSILMLVTLGGVAVTVVDRIARGRLPAQLLFSQLGLRSLDALAITLPLGAFIAVLLAYGRLYRDSEVAVLSASGMPPSGLLRPVIMIGTALAGLLAVVTLWLGPAAQRISFRMVDEANRSLLVAGFDAGRFVELPSGAGVIYVAEMNSQGTQFKKLFAYSERNGRADIVTAANGELFQDRQGSERYLSVSNGFRVEGDMNAANFRMMKFARNDIRLPAPESQLGKRAEAREFTRTLLQRFDRKDFAELQWRLSVPISLIILMLFALPLAKSKPREPRYGKLIIAILGYLLYTNVMSYMRGMIALNQLPTWLGLWWIHAAVLSFAIYLLWSGDRISTRKSL